MSVRFQDGGSIARNECDAFPLALYLGRAVSMSKGFWGAPTVLSQNPWNMPCLHLDDKADILTAHWGLMVVHAAKHPVRARMGVGDDLLLTAG